jgi:anti-sigma B factor antagonist
MQFYFQPEFAEEQESTQIMSEAEPQAADRLRFHPAPIRSDPSLAPDAQAGAPRCTDGTFSVRLLAARGDDQDTAVLSVHGEIDLGTAPVLREGLLRVLDHRTGPVVVDLFEVSFMDSTGVHVLVDTLRRLQPQNRPLAIVCREGGQVHRVLALLGLLDALAVYHSRESAVIGGEERIRSEPASDRQLFSGQALDQNQPGDQLAGQPS